MNKLFTKIAALVLGMTMAVGVGVAVGTSGKEASPVHAADTTYTFTSKSWADSTSSWTSDKDGGQLTSGQGVQVTTTYSGAGAHSKSSFTNISAIEFTYCTNASKGAGSISVTIGSNTAVTYSVIKTGGTTARTTSQTYATPQSGVVTFSVTCSQNSIYVAAIKITTSSGKTISSLTTDPDDEETVNLDAEGASSVDSSILYEVGYSDSTTGYDVEASCSPSSGVTISDDEAGELTLSFAANGTFEVTVEADESHSATITFVVTGIPTVEYELFTGTITAGDYVIMSGDANYTYVLGNTVSSSRIANGATAPTVSSNKIQNPSDDYVWHIAKDGNYWTIQNAANDKYLAGKTAKNNADLVDSVDDHARWTATYSSNWVFENLGRASDSDTPANRYLRNNTTSGWACYSSSQGNAPALFKMVSTEPAIEVEVTGETTLSVGETATLTATKINGATGNVVWSTNNSHVTLSATTGDSITVTGATDGSTDVTANLEGGSTVAPVVTTFTVNKALQSIAVTTEPTKTTYTEGESFDNAGMVITATYDDASTENPTDYTWAPSGALTPSTTEITISWGGKTTTQAITVNTKAVSSIVVKTNPTKSTYHSGDEFDSTGLVITVNYEGGTSSDITEGFEISPSEYTFTTEDEKAGSKTFTVTYGGQSTTFDVEVAAISGPIPSGNYYIMHIGADGVDYGASNESGDSAVHPSGIDLSVANTLGVFTFTLTDEDNVYSVKTGDKYLYCTNANNGAWVGGTEDNWTIEKVTHTSEEIADGEYDYYTMIDSNQSRYLTSYVTGTANDFRSYTYNSGYFNPTRHSNGQHARLMLIPEGEYSNNIAEAIMSDESPLCDGGVTAPSTSRWEEIAGITKIENELAILRNTEAAPKDEHGETPTGTTAEKAMARYDEIMVSYNTQTSTVYADFLGRISAQNLPIKASTNIFFGINDSNNAIAIVVIVSVVSLTAIGGYFFLRKKREQN